MQVECLHCGAAIVARGPEPAAGRYCMALECQRARYRAQNRLRGQPQPARPCTECGLPIPGSRAGVCSEICRRGRDLRRQRDSKRRAAAANPEYNRQRHAARRARAETDPAAAAQALAAARRRAARVAELRRTDLAYRERLREEARETYARHAPRIQAERRERRAALSPEEVAALEARERDYYRAYARRSRTERRADPVRYAAYIAYLVEWRRERALKTLLALGAELERRTENAPDD